jgi:RNA polymerase sigma factor (sigma-70 family)
MTTADMGLVLSHLRTLVAGDRDQDVPDGRLLDRFLATRDEAAFAELVRRHGPMVLAVCRRVLHDWHDAEEAFQATFLVLARKAGSIRRRDAVGGWLFGVAQHLARKARAAAARRARPERRAEEMPRSDPLLDLTLRELQARLYEELERLPEKYREPLVLCYLEGRTHAQAARQLGCSKDTLRGRVNRGREQLRGRLLRRGLALSGALVLTALAPEPASASGASRLTAATARAAAAFVTGEGAAVGAVSAQAAALAEGVSRATGVNKAKVLTAVLLAATVLLGGVGVAARREAAAQPPAPPPPETRAPAAERQTPPAAVAEKAGNITVSGRVLDPDGKPFAGARIYLATSTAEDRADPAGRATSGPDGRFRFSTSWSELNSNDSVMAVADGDGPAWAELSARGPSGALPPLRLVPDDIPIAGRVLDLENQPVADASVRVIRVRRMPDEDLGPWITDFQADGKKGFLDFGRLRVQARYERLMKAVGAVPGTPRSVRTGADGRFRLTGFGRERLVELAIDGPGLEHRQVTVLTRAELPRGLPPFTYPARFDHRAGPVKPIAGTVRVKGTGQPAAGVTVSCVLVSPGGTFFDVTATPGITATTDEQGRYRLSGAPKSRQYHLASGGGPFFATSQIVNDTAGLEPIAADFQVERGLLVRGRLTDAATGQPVRGTVRYVPRPDNPRLKEYPGFAQVSVSEATFTKDGSFAVAVAPGPGWLCARARDGRFARAVLDEHGAARALELFHPPASSFLLAIVQGGVGYPNPNRSHFESMTIWQTARLRREERQGLGWLGRALDASPAGAGVPWAVFVGGGQLPQALRGRRATASALTRPEDLALSPTVRARPLTSAAPPADDLAEFVRRSALDGYATAARMAEVARHPGDSAAYPPFGLADRLRLVARLIREGAGARIYHTSQPGYDTHAGQLGSHALLLREWAGALKAFLDDLAGSRLAEGVVVLGFSELGRTVRENGSAGTDHGTAGLVFLAGPGVPPGLVGTTPSLTDLDERHSDLKVGIDFRRVNATLLDDWLRVPAGPVLGGTFERLPLFPDGERGHLGEGEQER